MPRGGRGAARGATQDGRVSKPRCGRSLFFPISASENVEAVEPTPGPSIERSGPNSLKEQLKALKVAKALYAKNEAKLSASQKKTLEQLRQKKQVGNFRMPDAPEPKKGKGKDKKPDTRVWSSCPLLPGVPTVPPPYEPQPWELQHSRNVTEEEEDDFVEGKPPDFPEISQRMLARTMQSAGTPPRTAPESVMDVTDVTGEMCPLMIPGSSMSETVHPERTPTFIPDVTNEEMCPLLIIPGFSTVKLETVSPAKTPPPRKKNRDNRFSPSTGIIQSTVLHENPVLAKIEFVGLTPSSTTSTTAAAPGSGRSAYELDVNIDIERDCLEPGEGSDAENDECPVADTQNNGLRTVDEYPVDSDNLADPSMAEALRSIDAAADTALRTALGPGADQDLLNFDWRCEPENFEGTREVFTATSGPTFENAELTPLAVFEKIWDADFIALIVRETNIYGTAISSRNMKPNSRLNRWKDVTDGDIKTFFAIIMLQSLVVNNVEREYWYPKSEELRIGNFGAIMSYNRFLAIKRCLYFVDNASLPVHPNRLNKIMPIIEQLNQKFSSLYQLEQNVAIDESLLLWKGRLSFSQKIATKKARVGIKSYELCESRTGYLWRMEIYLGKGHVHVAQVGSQEPVEEIDQEDEPESATSQIVLTLMRPLFNRGHTLVMDNFYNAPLLSRILKLKHKTDSMGTLRLSREFVPEGLRKKDKKNMKSGEVAFSSTKDLNVVVWMDKNVVAMISSFHKIKVGGKTKYGYFKYKPEVILDYNLFMGGIDHKDQMLHAYPIERVRNSIWYKKLFRRLVNVSIHNSFVMFNHNRTQVLGNREFRLQLATELLQVSRSGALPRQLVPAAPAAPSQMHLPAKNKKPQRCKLCNAGKVRRTTVWRCSTCAVNLCIEGCYTDYHTQ